MKRKFTIPAVVLGSGKSGLGITRLLGLSGVPVINISYEKNEISNVSRFSSKNYYVRDPENAENFSKFLSGLSDEIGEAVLFPSDDLSLVAVSRYFNELSGKYIIPFRYSIMKELEILEKAEQSGIPAPRLFRPVSLDGAQCFAAETGFPVIMKSADNNTLKNLFGADSILIENFQHLRNLFTIASKFDRQIILQEYIPADEAYNASYSSLSIKGRSVLEFTSEETRKSSDNLFPRVIMSKYLPEIFESGRQIVKLLGQEGYTTIQFIKDARSKVYKFSGIINHRLDAFAVLAHKCGINFPLHTYLYFSKKIIPEQESSFRENIYYIDAGRDIPESFRNFRKEKSSLRKIFIPYLHSKVLAVPIFRDPMPLLKSSFVTGNILLKNAKFLLTKKITEHIYY